MKLFKKNLLYIVTLVIIATSSIFYSCNLSDCYDSSSFEVTCLIYDINGEATSMDSTTIYGLGSDSLLYNNETLKSFILPLKQDQETTSFIIEHKNNATDIDTLTFEYKKSTTLTTIECGAVTTATLDTCRISKSITTGGIFDSNIINEHQINSNTTDNVVLYKFNE